jgi:hypothetical protein
LEMLPAAASGFGKGLGEGVPIGLGIQPDPGMIPLQMMPNGTLDVSGVAQNFAVGLTSKLLANGTISKLMMGLPNADGTVSTSSTSGLLGSVDVGKAAGGFARGFIQGAGDAISAMGGVKALADGTAITPTMPIAESVVTFNDSINGGAVGFGQGLGLQGVMVANTILNSMKTPTTKKRDVDTIDGRSISARQTDMVLANGTSSPFNVSAFVTPESLSLLIQKTLNLLTGEGIGGLALVGLGLINSGAIPTNTNSTAVLSQFNVMIPPGITHFTNAGYNYDVNTQLVVDSLNTSLIDAANGIEINGNKVPAFAAFIALHRECRLFPF